MGKRYTNTEKNKSSQIKEDEWESYDEFVEGESEDDSSDYSDEDDNGTLIIDRKNDYKDELDDLLNVYNETIKEFNSSKKLKLNDNTQTKTLIKKPPQKEIQEESEDENNEEENNDSEENEDSEDNEGNEDTIKEENNDNFFQKPTITNTKNSNVKKNNKQNKDNNKKDNNKDTNQKNNKNNKNNNNNNNKTKLESEEEKKIRFNKIVNYKFDKKNTLEKQKKQEEDKKRKLESLFLDSLNDQEVIEKKTKKKRPSQKARRALAEKIFGENAKHLSSASTTQDTNKKPDLNDKTLHPSWKAKLANEAKLSQINKSKNNNDIVVFSDDE